MSNLYNRIASLCEEKNMTICGMCRKAGIPTSTVYDLKAGRSKDISRKNAEKIANALGIAVETLYTDAVDEKRDELFEKRKLLFDLSSKATEADLDKFIKMLNVMIGDED